MKSIILLTLLFIVTILLTSNITTNRISTPDPDTPPTQSHLASPSNVQRATSGAVPLAYISALVSVGLPNSLVLTSHIVAMWTL